MVISYEAITRADRMNEEIIGLLKKSGCFRIWIGAESGSQKILDAMNRMVKIERVKEMVWAAKASGIETGTFIMLGYPGETERDIQSTLEYLKAAQPDHFTITTAYPIKGTEMYDEVRSNFMDLPDWRHSSDRDIDFKRTYPRKYYDHATNWIINSYQSEQSRGLPKIIKKIKAFKSRAGMYIQKIKTFGLAGTSA